MEKKLDTNSNSYTLLYASILVVIVATVLACISSSLKEMQTTNVKLDTQKQILASLNGADVTFDQVQDMLLDGDSLVVYTGNFATQYKKEADEGRKHVFVCEVNGDKKYIFPVYGAGLWGAIWGYVALNSDKNTVYGTYFSHASETPGLGAEIATEAFQAKFIGKKTMNGNEIALSAVKNGKVENPEFQVDGISGGTITTKGLDDMLKNCLVNYTEFLIAK